MSAREHPSRRCMEFTPDGLDQCTRDATHVCSDADGLEWFACREHALAKRVVRTETLAAFFERVGDSSVSELNDRLRVSIESITREEFRVVREAVGMQPAPMVFDILALWLAQAVRFNHPEGLSEERTREEAHAGIKESFEQLLQLLRSKKE